MLTRPIPSEAHAIADEIRLAVPRPYNNPVMCEFRHKDDCAALRFWREGCLGGVCPMGLHPKSSDESPSLPDTFADGRFSEVAIVAYGDWWDEQTDADAAMDAQWPPK